MQRSPVHALLALRQFVGVVQRKGDKIRQAHSITSLAKNIFAKFLKTNFYRLLKKKKIDRKTNLKQSFSETMKELFLNDLLPPDRKLITFSQVGEKMV